MKELFNKAKYLLCMATLMFSLIFIGRLQVNAATLAPTGLKQTDATESSVKFSWDAVMQDSIYYYTRISNVADFTNCVSDRAYGTEDVYYNLTAGKTYYVQVGTSTVSSYGEVPADVVWSNTLQVTTAPAKVDYNSIKQTAVTTTTMTLKWTAPAGANYYQIKYWKSDDKKENAKVVATTTNSVKLSKLKTNSEYNVEVFSYRKSSAGFKAGNGYGNSKTYLPVLPSKIKGVTNTTFYPYINSADIEWTKSGCAEGYQYYVYNNSGKKILSGTYSYNKLSLNSSKLKKNQFYRIKVRGYVTIANNKKVYGAWSDKLYFARSPYSDVTVKKSGSKMKASWEKITGATNYTIYVSTKQNSGYKKVGTTKKTNISISKCGSTKLKKGKTYYIKIVANKKVGSKTFKSNVYYVFEYKFK